MSEITHDWTVEGLQKKCVRACRASRGGGREHLGHFKFKHADTRRALARASDVSGQPHYAPRATLAAYRAGKLPCPGHASRRVA